MGVKQRVTSAWNVLRGKDHYTMDIGTGSSYPSHKVTPRFSESSYANSIFNRIAVDCSMVEILHVKMDDKTKNETRIRDGVHKCLTVEANLDQSATEFLHDIVYSMFDEGVVAVVPIDTTKDPNNTEAFDIHSMRVGKITQWFPQHVKVRVYNELTGVEEEVYLEKKYVAIIENPLYSVINDKNSTLKRLISKLALLDLNDELYNGSKMDLIIQLPYTVKTRLKKEEANDRINQLEQQLNHSKYGIGYTDGSEKVTQLNRPVTNNLLPQVESLKEELYNQLGLTQNVFNGTATEAQMRTYYNRTIDPILTRIVKEFQRKFLSKTARTQGQTFTFRRDPFKLVPVEQLASIADTFSRNALLTPNEIRPIIGFGPSQDPEADKLSNRNIADKNQKPGGRTRRGSSEPPDGEDSNQNGGNSSREEET